ncbi:MAG: YqgE/AlgH family protein [Chitinophagaceae bacterium]|nr:YqgE/AlgH family protein [Chitinophagaceae bacterium]
MKPGTYIKSTDLLKGDYFENAIIIITEVNVKGAMGFVINRNFPRKFNELEEFRHSPAFPLYEGGPVDTEHIFVLHRRADLIPDSQLITDGIYYGGDFKETVKLINNKTLIEKDIRLIIGYCGWNESELVTEVAEGSWKVVDNYSLF